MGVSSSEGGDNDMSPLNEVAREVSEQARQQAHEIQWGIVGDQIAHGTCTRCGMTVRLEADGSGYISKRTDVDGMCSSQP